LRSKVTLAKATRLLLAAQKNASRARSGPTLKFISARRDIAHVLAMNDKRERSSSMNDANLKNQRSIASNVSVGEQAEMRSTIALLRDRTATLHCNLESHLQIQNRLSEVETRGPLIAAYGAFLRGTEVALKPHLWDMSGLAFTSRLLSRQINSQTALPRHRSPLVGPVIGTTAEALGVFYVLEGSTLGGKTILKALRSRGVSTGGLHFLDPYGKETGSRWRAFLSVLEREIGPNQINACVHGAMKGFAFAAMCLRAERAN
jgi:heme oxygenase (biliverdin-IX-beta and delta-forming)